MSKAIFDRVVDRAHFKQQNAVSLTEPVPMTVAACVILYAGSRIKELEAKLKEYEDEFGPNVGIDLNERIRKSETPSEAYIRAQNEIGHV